MLNRKRSKAVGLRHFHLPYSLQPIAFCLHHFFTCSSPLPPPINRQRIWAICCIRIPLACSRSILRSAKRTYSILKLRPNVTPQPSYSMLTLSVSSDVVATHRRRVCTVTVCRRSPVWRLLISQCHHCAGLRFGLERTEQRSARTGCDTHSIAGKTRYCSLSWWRVACA